jgi:hypothetical protein
MEDKLAAVQQDGVPAIVDMLFEITEVKRLLNASLTFDQGFGISAFMDIKRKICATQSAPN